MESIATENLFLLEFLVDGIDLDDACDCNSPKGQMCVSFQFLDNAALDVCENDFLTNDRKDPTNVKTGKSCLFSMTPAQAEESTQQFDVTVTVFKKMQPGWLPERLDLGKSLISIVNLFKELIDSMGFGSNESPAAKTLKDTFRVFSEDDEDIGSISVYIRMSCFGKLIVTQFQMNLDDKSVLFKDKEGRSMYRYKKSSKKMGADGELVDTAGPGGRHNPNCPNVPCFPPQGPGGGQNLNCPSTPCPRPQQQRQPYQTPCNECARYQNPMMTPPCDRGMTTEAPCNECGTQDDETTPPRPSLPEDPNACYQEIGASMGGNALTIRVHKDLNAAEGSKEANVDVADTDDCSCTPENYGKKRKKQRLSCEVSPQSYSVTPGVPGTKSPFAVKVGGNAPAGRNNVTMVTPVCTAPDGTKYTELSDPDRDVFILRIGKKNEGVDKKSKLELELCTPKGPELKPAPKKETRDTQYDPNDAGPVASPRSAKGKGDKKGKDKKGGKKGKKK